IIEDLTFKLLQTFFHTPDNTANSTTSTSATKTGDSNMVSAWLILLAAGCFAVVVAARKRLVK
ncbi:MAG: hypothetical protein LUD14_10720, partial [Clostridiales bacterium]|nr:hypothetical protein [Clostridiales bacterium]